MAIVMVRFESPLTQTQVVVSSVDNRYEVKVTKGQTVEIETMDSFHTAWELFRHFSDAEFESIERRYT